MYGWGQIGGAIDSKRESAYEGGMGKTEYFWASLLKEINMVGLLLKVAAFTAVPSAIVWIYQLCFPEVEVMDGISLYWASVPIGLCLGLSYLLMIFVNKAYQLETPKFELIYEPLNQLQQAGYNDGTGLLRHDFALMVRNKSGVQIKNFEFQIVSITPAGMPERAMMLYLKAANNESSNITLTQGDTYFPFVKHSIRANYLEPNRDQATNSQFSFVGSTEIFSEWKTYMLKVKLTADGAKSVEKYVAVHINPLGLCSVGIASD